MSFLLTPARRATTSSSTSLGRLFSTTRPASLARMTLVGRLGVDPEVQETSKGSVVKYVVGTSSGPKDNRQTSWFRVTSFAPEQAPLRDYVLGLKKG
jgi:hypothetical protein